MNQDFKLKMSDGLTKIHSKYRKLGASQKDLDIFNNLIKEIENYKEESKTLGELF